MSNGADHLEAGKALEAFKFYEEAAEKTKGHAWSQTTWILTLNAGILAFSFNLYAEYRTLPLLGFLVIEWMSAVAGVVLCWMLFYVLSQLGEHISGYWENGNRIAATTPSLVQFIGEKKKKEVWQMGEDYGEPFPPFCERLQLFALIFMGAHILWALAVTALKLSESPIAP